MEIITYNHQLPFFASRQTDRYFGGLRMGVFDIETTGLSPTTSQMILAGIMAPQANGTCRLTQYFAEEKSNEPDILMALTEEFQHFDLLLTYNGRHFDLPYITTRAQLRHVDEDFNDCYNLDLYLILKGHSQLKSVLGNLKQKTVERYMGLCPKRADTIDGGESIRLYEEFLRAERGERKEQLKQTVLLHNHDDLLQLYQLLPILRQTELHRAMRYLGFPVIGLHDWPQLNISRIRLDYAGLTVIGTYRGAPFSYLSYETLSQPCSCAFYPDRTFRILIPTQRQGTAHYVNLRTLFRPEEEERFLRFPGYVNGFLVLANQGQTGFLETNLLVKNFLHHFMDETTCPISSMQKE